MLSECPGDAFFSREAARFIKGAPLDKALGTSGRRLFFLQGMYPLWIGLDETEKESLIEATSVRMYPPHATIYAQGEEARCFYIVLAGCIRLVSVMRNGNVALLDILSAGDSCGEISALKEEVYMDTALAAGRTVLARVDFAQFFIKSLRRDVSPSLVRVLALLIARRSKLYMENIRALSLPSLSVRLARVIIALARKFGQVLFYEQKPYPALPAFITQSDLGALSRGSRGNVNRLLRKWEADGWIAMSDRTIVIVDMNKIEMIKYGQEES